MLEYTGYKEVIANDQNLAYLYEAPSNNIYGCLINEYLIIKGDNGEVVDSFRWTGNQYSRVIQKQINNSFSGKIKSRNIHQTLAIDALYNNNITVKAISGDAGTGKSFLILHSALDLLAKGKFQKLIYIRNNIEVSGVTKLGALPGDAYSKLEPFYDGFSDHVGNMFMMNDKISFAHLGFMRGRDIRDSILIVNEAENLTADHVEMLVARCNDNTELWLDGDVSQVDSQIFKESNGLATCIEVLKGDPLFAHVQLVECERGTTARLAKKFRDFKKTSNKVKI